jgi:hypothetical protein
VGASKTKTMTIDEDHLRQGVKRPLKTVTYTII